MWEMFALGSSFAMAVATVISRKVLQKVWPAMVLFYSIFITLVLLLPISFYETKNNPFARMDWLCQTHGLNLLYCGLSFALGSYFYHWALGLGQAVEVTITERTSLLFIMILSMGFLGDKITVGMFAGAVAMFLGAVYIALVPTAKDQPKRSLQSRWFVLGMLSAVLLAISTVFCKCLLNCHVTLWEVVIWRLLVTLVVITVLLVITIACSHRLNKNGHLPANKLSLKLGRDMVLSVVIIGIATAFAWYYGFMAMELADVARVDCIRRMSIIFIVILSPSILQEKPTKQVVIGLIMVFVGGILVIF